MRFHPSWALALCALTVTPSLATQTLVVPAAPAAATANSNNTFPWGRTTSQIRIQHQFAAQNFASITAPVFITRLRFRATDTSAVTTTWTGGTYNGARISMSSAVNAYAAMSTTFAANHGTDLAQVFPTPSATNLGPITVAAGAGTGAGIPGLWYVDIPLSQPFAYNPALGKDLLIDIQLDGSWSGGTSTSTASYSGVAASPQGSRMYNTSDWQGLTGTLAVEHTPGMEITYLPQTGLHAGFSATPVQGNQNLQVQFTDTSFSSAPGGITSWTWDFGDGSPPSNVQNPLHTYKCGKFSPKLTVTDSVHPPSSLTLTGLIEAGLVEADFTASGTFGNAPYQVTFTDTSTGGPTAWEWDFGDGSQKSTAQNPVHVFTKGGKHTVSLKATGGCNNDTEIKVGLVEVCVPGGNSGSLSTIFTGGNGLTAANCGNLFDVKVLNPTGVKITSIDINTRAAATANVGIDVYITPGAYLGKENNQAVWVKVSTGTGVSMGGLVPTPIDVADFYLAPGDYGMYVIFHTAGMHYTNATATNTTYQNCDIQIVAGSGKNAMWSGALNPGRIWNGTLHYAANDQAGSGAYGYGCPGSNSLIPALSLSAAPQIGTSGNLLVKDLLNVPSGSALLFLGATKQILDLTIIGMPSCFLHCNVIGTLGLTNVNGTATMPYSIPNSASLVGGHILLQAAGVDAAANTLGVAASNGLSVRLGN